MWRESTSEPWSIWAFVRNNFGDKCASLALELGKKATSERAMEIDPQAAKQLLDCSFVDDVGGVGALERRWRE